MGWFQNVQFGFGSTWCEKPFSSGIQARLVLPFALSFPEPSLLACRCPGTYKQQGNEILQLVRENMRYVPTLYFISFSIVTTPYM